MGQPAVLLGDPVTGTCPGHQLIGPIGTPVPAPPMPFSAPLTLATSTSVLIAGKPVALAGSRGLNMPPHIGLHASDPKMAPPLQQAEITGASGTVLIEGKGAAYANCAATACIAAGVMVVGTGATVLIGA